MNTAHWIPGITVRQMDFAGGTVIHVSWYIVLGCVLAFTALVWLALRKL